MRVQSFNNVLLLSAATLSGVLASPNSALQTLNFATTSLDNSLARWPGDLITMVPIVFQMGTVLKDIESATSEFQQAGDRSETDEPALLQSMKTVQSSLGHVINTVIAQKDKLSHGIPFGADLSYAILRHMSKSANDLLAAAVKGSPASSAKDVQNIKTSCEGYFKKALKAFD